MSPSSRFAEEELAGWGGWPRRRARRYRPEQWSTLAGIVAGEEPRLIARGGGRAYGDAALPSSAEGHEPSPSGAVVDFTRLNRFLHFDPERGRITAEAGVTLDELLAVTVPRGWLPSVLPGTRHCTLGGMVACDVHGKNHPTHGTMRDGLESLTVQLVSGERIECGPKSRADLFHATCGGLGLTGWVREATLKLRPIESAFVKTVHRRVNDLASAVEALEGADHEFAVVWLDGLYRGGAGAAGSARGIVHLGDLATRDELDAGVPGAAPDGEQAMRYRAPRSWPVPRLPISVVHAPLVRAHNAWRWWCAGRTAAEDLRSFGEFFFPLDRLRSWGRLYGPAGFQQYQCQVPTGGAVSAIARLLEVLHDQDSPSFLTVLKRFGGPAGGHGMLSFPAPGITASFDFPQRPGLEETLARLDQVVLAEGGRLYLAKDARLDRETFARMYPQRASFLEVKRSVDPAGRLESALSRRLGLTLDPAEPPPGRRGGESS